MKINLGRAVANTKPTDQDRAYAAGFFDGEGHITIAFMSAKIRAKGPVYTMRIGAAQNDVAPLLWFRDRWGGSVLPCNRLTIGGNKTHKWNCCSRKAAAFLRDVYPFLQVKRERADIALRFQDMLFIPGKRGHTPEYREALESLRLKMAVRNTHKPLAARAA